MRFLTSILSIPGLEKYSDEEYEKLVWRAKIGRGDAIWVIPALCGLLAAGAWLGIGFGLSYAMRKMGTQTSGLWLARWWAVNVAVGCIIAIAAGAAVRWLLIVRSIRRLVNKAGCPFCEFSLIGLRVKQGWVRCPECGQRVYLHEHRLTEDDLIPEGHRPPPVPGAGEWGAYQGMEGAKQRQASRRGGKSA